MLWLKKNTMKNETAQLEVTYRMSFPDKGKQPPPAGSESLIQKMDQIQTRPFWAKCNKWFRFPRARKERIEV